MEIPRLRFALSRDVRMPERAGEHEAGIDFFMPRKLFMKDILDANAKVEDITIYYTNDNWPPEGMVYLNHGEDGYITGIILGAGARIIIPSGVHALIEPWNSALIAANKSGVSTKKGLIFGAQVVDSTYTGEIHISLINTSDNPQVVQPDDKVIQFIHTPILLTSVEKINWDGIEGFLEISKGWSKRGDNWQGSTNNVKDIEPYDDKPNA